MLIPDHYNLIPYVLQDVDIGKVIHVGRKWDYATKTVPGGFDIDEWFASVQDRTTRLSLPAAADLSTPSQLFNCGRAQVTILAAGVEKLGSWWKNTQSIVLKVTYGEFDAILAGDATTVTEDFILANHEPDFLRAELLKLGHHGSSTTSTSQAWADAVQPEMVVASAGFKNSHGHPRREIVERVAPQALDWEPHDLVSSTGRRGNYRWHWVENYGTAVFNTASSGNIVVLGKRDGSFDVTWFEYE